MDTKKYIIEIPDNTAWLQWVKVSDKDGHVCFDFKDPEDLTLYTEPDLDAVRKEAYEKGYQGAAVKIGSDEQKIAEKAYQRGLNDAWETVRKIADLPTAEERENIFACAFTNDVIRLYTATEAIEKIRQYKQEKEEIKVGDEVEMKCGVRPAIYMQGTKGSDEIYLLFSDGSCGVHSKSEIERKTGRHFPGIVEILKKMQEGK